MLAQGQPGQGQNGPKTDGVIPKNFNGVREHHFRGEEKCSGNDIDIGQHVQDLEESAYTPEKI